MKLSQLEKRIQQRPKSTRGQANEDWALYKSNPSGVSWGDLSCLPCWDGNTFARGLLFTWATRESPNQNQFTRQNEKKTNKQTKTK